MNANFLAMCKNKTEMKTENRRQKTENREQKTKPKPRPKTELSQERYSLIPPSLGGRGLQPDYHTTPLL